VEANKEEAYARMRQELKEKLDAQKEHYERLLTELIKSAT